MRGGERMGGEGDECGRRPPDIEPRPNGSGRPARVEPALLL